MGKISKQVTTPKISRPSICFHHLTDTVVSLDELDRDALMHMLKKFKLLGGISWNEISKSSFGWEKIPQHSMNYTIPKNIGLNELYHIKITSAFRVWGYRDGDAFHLVWIDPNHKVTKG